MSLLRAEQQRRPAVAALLAIAIAASQPVLAAESPRVEVRERPDGPAVESVELIVPPTDTTVKRQLFLVQAGDQPIQDHLLVAVLEGSASITVTPLGGAAGDPVTVPAGGVPVLVTLEATMTRPGTASGELRGGPALESVARLRVEKSLPAAVTVQGASDATGLTLATESPTFRQTLRIVSNVEVLTEVRLVPSLFTGPTGTQAAATVEQEGVVAGGPLDVVVPGFGSVPVTVSLATPLAGDYRGELALTFGDQRKSVPIKVTRSRVDPTVAFESLAQRRATIGLLCPEPIDARFAIRETSGAATSVHDLTAELVKVVDTEVEVQTDIGPGGIFEGGAEVPDPLVFSGGERKSLQVRVDDLRWPGHYRANLRASSAHGGKVEATLDLLVRFPLCVALGVIFLAVGASHLLRTYFSTGRKRLLDQQRIASYRERLTAFAGAVAPTDETETRLLELLGRHLEQYYLRTRAVPPGEIAVELGMIEIKLGRILRRWLEARRRAVRAAAGDLLEELSKVERFLRQRVPAGTKSAEQEAQEHEQTLAEIEAKLDQDYGLTARIESFRAALQSRQGASPGRYAAVQQALDEASRTDAPETAREKAFRRALGSWTRQLAEELEQEVPAATAPPTGFDVGEWSGRRQEVLQHAAAARQRTVPEDALREYEAGATLLLRSLIDGLARRMAERKQGIESMADFANRPDLKEAAKALAGFAARLADARKALDNGERGAAETTYNEAVAGYRGLMKKIGLPMNVAAESEPAESELPEAAALAGIGGPAAPAIDVPSSAELRRRLYYLDLVTTVVVLIVAALLGVHLLYSPDATWGSAGDIILAILWGLGLHAVGGKTFEGTDWIRKQFGLPES